MGRSTSVDYLERSNVLEQIADAHRRDRATSPAIFEIRIPLVAL
jgi:hypothetical protein